MFSRPFFVTINHTAMANYKRFVPLAGVLLAGAVGISSFGITTGLFTSPLILFTLTIFLLYPFRQQSYLVKRLLTLSGLLFVLWLFGDMGVALLPFGLSFFLAYLLDPIVTRLSRSRFPRWLAALLIIVLLGGAVTVISVLVFPVVFNQLDEAIRKVSSLVNSVTSFLESRKFYRMLAEFGLPQDKMKEIMQTEFMPKLETLFATVLQALLSLLTGVSGLASQLINVILLPILTFYFVKDMPALKDTIRTILQRRNKRVYNDIVRINAILRTYVGWQLVASLMIGTAASSLFALFGVPYPIVLGVLCALLNPIPIFGSLASMFIAMITVLLVNPPDVWTDIVAIAIIINGLHFANAYLVEPRILGKQIGLHPIILLASLFIFGHFFGFLGLLTAVPVTAVLMMFYRDWIGKTDTGTAPIQPDAPMNVQPEIVVNNEEQQIDSSS